MLVLTRKKGESILIGSDIEVKIVDVKGSYVRVGIDAPKVLKILRDELLVRDELMHGTNNELHVTR